MTTLKKLLAMCPRVSGIISRAFSSKVSVIYIFCLVPSEFSLKKERINFLTLLLKNL